MFASAPAATHRAIIDFVNGRGEVRRRARRALLACELPNRPASAPPPTRRAASSHPDDLPIIERLRDAHRQLNLERFHGALGPVELRVSRRMTSRLGHFSPGHLHGTPEIAISRRHLRRDSWASITETLIHEMVHQWQHETGRALAHDPEFRRMARAVGIAPAARRHAGRTD